VGWKFLESIGDKIAGAAKGDDKGMATALADKVTESKLDIDDLEIEFSAGVATISGIAADDATVEKAVLIVGNTEGVSEVEADGFIAGVTDAEKAEYAKARAEAIVRARKIAADRAAAASEAADEEKDTAEAEKAARVELRQRREDRQGVLRRRVQVPGHLRGQQADAEERRSHLPGPGAADSAARRLTPTEPCEGSRSGGGLHLCPTVEAPACLNPLNSRE